MNQIEFERILKDHKRIAITGGPRSGKSSLARTVTDRPVFHNDDGKHVLWQNQPEYWKQQVAGQDSFVIEGVQAVRALRKGLQVDAVIELDKPHVPRSKGQEAMAKGQKTIFADVMKQNPRLKVYK